MISRPPRSVADSSLRRLGSRTAALFQLDNLGPALIVIVAVVISLEPKPFGIEISDQHVILALFALLGVDAVIERSGRLKSLDGKLDVLSRHLVGPVAAEKVLRTRASFDRMDVLLSQATRSIAIVGINLEGAISGLSPILDLARTGGTIKLLAMDPDGVCIEASAAMSRVEPEIRRQKIRQNLDLIKTQLSTNLSKADLRHVSLLTVDAVLPVSVVALDQDDRQGSLVVQHHLTATQAEKAPMFVLSKKEDAEWFQRYLDQSMACFEGANEW
jgi:hypothetical protein